MKPIMESAFLTVMIVCVIMAGITVGSTPASAAYGDLEIVDVEEVKNGKSIDELSEDQPIDVTIEYSLNGQSSYTVGVYDKDFANFGNNDELATTQVDDNEGQVELTVPAGEIADELDDDLNRERVELQAGVPAYGNPIEQFELTSDVVNKDIVTSTVYLQDVPSAIPKRTTGSVTLYGWSENSLADWELAESDTLGDNQIAIGSAFVDNAGYYEEKVEFEADEYTGGFGDPPIDVLAKSTDSSSTSETFEIGVPEPPEPPTADFSVEPNRQLNPGETAFFDPFDSTAPDGRIVEYNWDWDNDGIYEDTTTGGTGHAFDTESDQTVRLNVVDDNGLTDTVTKTVEMNQQPTADFEWDPESPTDPGDVFGAEVTFFGSYASDPDGSIDTYEWELRKQDGSLTKRPDGMTPTVDKLYVGTYEMTLTVTDTDGGTDSITKTFSVSDGATPTASAGADTTTSVGEPVTFDASGSSDNVGIDRYEWDLDGDGTYEATGKRVSQSYTKPGTTPVTVRVEDAAGNTDTDTLDVTVEDRTDPTAVTGSDRSVSNGETVRLDGSDSFDNVGVTDYYWDVDGDGSYEETGPEVTETFETTGTTTVELRVRDAAGNTDTETVEITVEQEADTTPPDADAGADTTATVGEPVELDGSRSTDNRAIATYEWDVDADGTYEESGASVDHVFESAGSKPVTLLVTDAAGNTDTDTVTVQVEEANDPEVTAEAGGPYSVTASESVELDASGSTATNTEIVATEWELLDQVGAIEGDTYQPPDELAADQTVQVQLTVTTADGTTDTDTAEIAVDQQSPPDDPSPTLTLRDLAVGGTEPPATITAGDDDPITAVLENPTTTEATVTTELTVGETTASTETTVGPEATEPVRFANVTADLAAGNYTVTTQIQESDATLRGDLTVRAAEITPPVNKSDPMVNKTASSVSPTTVTAGKLETYDVTIVIENTSLNSSDSGEISVKFNKFNLVDENSQTPIEDLQIDFTTANISDGIIRVTETVSGTAPQTTGSNSVNITSVKVNNTGGSDEFLIDDASMSIGTIDVVEASSNDIVVDPDPTVGEFNTIQAAVSNATDGDTIEVRSGTYSEQVTIGTNLTVTASEGAQINYNGTVGVGSAVEITDGAAPTIEGLTVTAPNSSGIDTDGAGAGWVVRDVTITETDFAAVRVATDGIIEDSRIQDADVGVTRISSAAWTLKNTTITQSGTAIRALSSDSDWRLQNVTISESDLGVNAINSESDWKIHDSTFESLAGDGVLAMGSTGEWEIHNSQIRDTSRGINAQDSTGDWDVAASQFTEVLTGIDAAGSPGQWAVRKTTIASKDTAGEVEDTAPSDGTAVYAVDTTGAWKINQSTLVNNRVGVNATGADATGNATYNYWGASDGPSGDFNGSGAVASGDVVISPFYTDTELTTLNTESRVEAITIEHNPGSATASTPTGDGRAYADQLDIFVNTDDPVAFGGQGDLHLRVVDPETGNAVTYTPTSNARTVPLGEMYRLGIQNDGTGEPQEEILLFPESNSDLSFADINATVEGDTGIYTNETFNEYVIKLVDDDGNVIDSTDTRLVGMGYKASFGQDGETALVTRDPAVDPSWTAEFALVGDNSSIPPSEQVIDTVEVNHTEGDEHFEIPLGELDADPGEYSWTLTIVDESRAELDRERIVSISGDPQLDTGVTIRDGFGQTDPQPDVTLQSPRPASQTTPTAFDVTVEQQEPETVTLEVLDSEGNVVFEESAGDEFENETFVTWDSTNQDGDVVADGEYDVVVTVEDQAGTEVTAEETVTVDNTAPTIENLELVEPADGKTNDQITVEGDISDTETDLQFVEAAVAAESTSYVATESYDGTDTVETALEDGTLEVRFDATAISNDVGDGEFRIGMAAVDEAGNDALVEGDSFTIDTSPPSIQPGVSGLAEDTAMLRVEADEDVTITDLDIEAASSESESTANRTPASYDTDVTPDEPATIDFDGGTVNDEDTTFSIDIEAEDAAGNTDTYTLTSSISSYQIEEDGTAEVDPSAVDSSFGLATNVESGGDTEREAMVAQSTSTPAGTELADNQVAGEFIDVTDIGLTEEELEEANVRIPLSEIDIEGFDDDELTMLYSPDGESDYETIDTEIVEDGGQEYLVASVDGFSQLAPAGIDDEAPTIESPSVDPGTNINLADDGDSATVTFDYRDAVSEINTTATSVNVSGADSDRVSTQITKSTTKVDVTGLEEGELIDVEITVVDDAGNAANEEIRLSTDDTSTENEGDTEGGEDNNGGGTTGGTSGGGISGGASGGGTSSGTGDTTNDETSDTDDTSGTDGMDDDSTDESTDGSMDDPTEDDSSDDGVTDDTSPDSGTSDDETTDDSTPGFGALVALVALIAATLMLTRRES